MVIKRKIWKFTIKRKEKRVKIKIFSMVILSSKIMQNYHKNHHLKVVRVIYPKAVVT